MQIHFGKSSLHAFVLVLVVASYAIAASSSDLIRRSIGFELPTPTEVAVPVKIENISVDYAHAHAELMKKPNDAVVDSF